MRAYPDTSVLVSAYVPEAHSTAAERVMGDFASSLVLCPLHELEFTNALELAVFRRKMTPAEALAVWRDFEGDLGHWALHPLPVDVFARATRLARRHTARYGARSLDVLHVAIAIALEAEVLLTFDKRQRRLAKAEKLRVAPRVS
jgi:predicted nucleic acid-binding protein